MLRVYGEKLLAAYGGDAYVSPEHRRRGIAQSLHEANVLDLRERGVACNFGVGPVPANFRAFLRAGALSPCDFYYYNIPLNSEPLVSRLPLGILSGVAQKALNPLVAIYSTSNAVREQASRLSIREFSKFDTEFDDLFENVSKSIPICGQRDASYLNWRYVDNPFNSYTLLSFVTDDTLAGYSVLRQERNRWTILDFLASTDGGLDLSCLCALLVCLRKKSARSLTLFLNPKSASADIFLKCKFRKSGIKMPLMVLTDGASSRNDMFDKSDAWFLLPGDKERG
jgi:predicted GNAT family acetyltransferase